MEITREWQNYHGITVPWGTGSGQRFRNVKRDFTYVKRDFTYVKQDLTNVKYDLTNVKLHTHTDPHPPRSIALRQCEDAEATAATEHCLWAVRGRESPTTANDLARRPHVATQERGRRPCKGGGSGGAVVAESAQRQCVVAAVAVVAESVARQCVVAGVGLLPIPIVEHFSPIHCR